MASVPLSNAKKHVKYFVVDAFSESAFKGNPAAVCFLEDEKEEKWLQALAAEFNISQTSFITPITPTSDSSIPSFRLRWFTPVAEVKLCGHATLASAHVLFSSGSVDSDVIEFQTLSGILVAKRIPALHTSSAPNLQKDLTDLHIELDFPADPVTEFNFDESASLISEALGGASIIDVKRTTIGDCLLVIISSGKAVSELQPQLDAIVKCPAIGLIVSGVAPSDSEFDFISRFFCPKLGVSEDPVCGSAHCALTPYWSKKLGKCDFKAYQASPRGGVLNIHFDEATQRVLLRGKAVTVMEGHVVV